MFDNNCLKYLLCMVVSLKNTYGATIKKAGRWRAAIGFRETKISIRVYKIETKLCLKMKLEENETLNYDIFSSFDGQRLKGGRNINFIKKPM